MDSLWKISSSLKTMSGISIRASVSPARKTRYLPQPKRFLLISSQKSSNKNLERKFHTPTPKTTESPLPLSNSKQHFKPTTKLYLELSSSPSPYDLRSRNLQKDIDSAQKLLNYSEMDEKKQKVKKEFKALTKKDIRKIENEREELMELDIEMKKPHLVSTEFFKAIKQGEELGVVNFLKEYPELVRESDSTKQTGLHWAVRRNYLKIAEILLRAGASVMAKDMVGRRPEDIARSKKLTYISEILIAARRRTANLSRIFVGDKTKPNTIMTLRNMKVRRPVENLNTTLQ